MIANLARKNNSITSDVFINKTKKANSENLANSQSVGLSYLSYFKNVSTPRHASAHVKSKDHYQFEYAQNGSYVRLAEDRIDPYVTSPMDYRERETRGVIKGFSKSSQRRFLAFVSRIDQAEVDTDEILFITLTAPSEHWRQVSWQQWKSRLNNFNTQLRQKFKDSPMCGVWRMEFQRRGAFHVHICLFKVKYLDHDWVAEKWNNICCKKTNMSAKAIRDHRNASTSVEVARDWRAVGSYFNKTLAYLAKDIVTVSDPKMRNEIEQFGRHWGYINKKNINKLINMIKGDFQEKSQFDKVRRWTRKLANSKQRTRFDRMKRSSDKMKIKKDKNGKPIKRDGKVVMIKVADCNQHHQLSKRLKRIFDSKHTKVGAFISDQTFKKMLMLADVDIDQAIDDSRNRWKKEQEKRKKS